MRLKHSFCNSENRIGSELLQVSEVSHKSWSLTIRLVIKRLPYIAFASEETFLFKLLFVTDMDLDMKDANDFYTEIGNEQKAETFSEMIGVDLETAKRIFLDLFLYSHGIAVLTASGKLALQRDKIEDMVQRFLSALINQEHAEKVC